MSQKVALHPMLGHWGAELPPDHCGKRFVGHDHLWDNLEFKGPVTTLQFTPMGSQPKTHPDTAALSWSLHCGTSMAQAGSGGKSSWEILESRNGH